MPEKPKKPKAARTSPSYGKIPPLGGEADPASVAAAERIVAEMDQVIEDLPERAQADGAEFFESVTDKAAAIMETVRKNGRATDGQTYALENMLKGCRKWCRGED